MPDTYFTVEPTSATIPKRGALAIFAGERPRKNAEGHTVHSLRAPLLILPPDMFQDEEAVARKIADLLNQNAHLFFDSAKTEPVAGDRSPRAALEDTMSDPGYYLRAILRRLREFQDTVTDAALDGAENVSWLGNEALSDEIEWLDGWSQSAVDLTAEVTRLTEALATVTAERDEQKADAFKWFGVALDNKNKLTLAEAALATAREDQETSLEEIRHLQSKLSQAERDIATARAEGVAEGMRMGLDRACSVIDAHSEYDQNMCCSGHECGCHGSSVHQALKHWISSYADDALIPAPRDGGEG